MTDKVIYEGDNVLDVAMTPIPAIANLHGVVIDAETGALLSGVTVTIDGLVTYTVNGSYLFEGLTPGGYTVTFEKDGYETETR